MKRELPKYKSHKVVQAVKIQRVKVGMPVDDNPLADVIIIPEGNDLWPIKVSEEYINKHKPKKGGYYVVYEDGYESFSPAKSFEEGYTKLEGEEDELKIGELTFGEAVEALKSGNKVSRKGWNGKGMWLQYVSHTSLPETEIKKGEIVEVLPWIGMKTADNRFVPWLASQTDILSTDWKVLPED